jgi:hypothetical protein
MNKDWYEIKDFDGFINHSRAIVFKCFGESAVDPDNDDDITDILSVIDAQDQEEMDRVLSKSECEIIAKGFMKTKISKKSNKTKYFINEKILYDILESFNSRMVSNMVNKLVNDGLLESAFDVEKNDFIFWRKNIENKKENPETD